MMSVIVEREIIFPLRLYPQTFGLINLPKFEMSLGILELLIEALDKRLFFLLDRNRLYVFNRLLFAARPPQAVRAAPRQRKHANQHYCD
jgi:hypothetical protein